MQNSSFCTVLKVCLYFLPVNNKWQHIHLPNWQDSLRLSASAIVPVTPIRDTSLKGRLMIPQTQELQGQGGDKSGNQWLSWSTFFKSLKTEYVERDRIFIRKAQKSIFKFSEEFWEFFRKVWTKENLVTVGSKYIYRDLSHHMCYFNEMLHLSRIKKKINTVPPLWKIYLFDSKRKDI